jgi:hypothetical protein
LSVKSPEFILKTPPFAYAVISFFIAYLGLWELIFEDTFPDSEEKLAFWKKKFALIEKHNLLIAQKTAQFLCTYVP